MKYYNINQIKDLSSILIDYYYWKQKNEKNLDNNFMYGKYNIKFVKYKLDFISCNYFILSIIAFIIKPDE